MEKNKAGLTLGIISAIFGIIGGLVWMACSAAVDSLMEILSEADLDVSIIKEKATILLVMSIGLGIGGSVTSLVGGIQAYHFKKGGFICAAVGCACQLGFIITIFAVFGDVLGGLSIGLCIETIVALILAAVQTLITGLKWLNNRKKPAPAQAAATAPAPASAAAEIAATEEKPEEPKNE